MKDKISFSSMIGETTFHTFIDLLEGTMSVRKNVKTVEIQKNGLLEPKEKSGSEENVLFFGTIAEFKNLKNLKKGSFSDRIYDSVLNMAEHLIEAFSSK